MGGEEGIVRWPDTVEDLVPFESLSKFERIGLGGFGCVYKAKMEGYKRPVAVKVLAVNRPNVTAMFVQEAAVLRMVEHENIVQYIGVVNIPQGARHIAEAIDGPKLAFIEEYLEGGTVQNLLMKQMISPFRKVYSLELALDFLLGIASALRYLHKLRPLVLHRDLTPDNILVTKKNGRLVAKLIDFGLTMLIDENGEPVNRLSTMFLSSDSRAKKAPFEFAVPPSSTDDDIASPEPEIKATETDHNSQAAWPQGENYDIAAGENENQNHENEDDHAAVMRRSSERLIELPDKRKSMSLKNLIRKYNLTGQTGSYMYMAPEVYSCSPYNESADVFSFGVIMYEIFSRNLLVVSETDMESPIESKLYADKVSKGFRPKMPENLPIEVKELVQQCTAGNPCDRPSFSEIVSHLHDLEESEILNKAGEVSCCRCM
ncbi:hypothetical protein BSKO_06482 [Bryopsis sp. KO-2023]|nr:hypothetical protein BSKO_06482 [Bryopsis sp. KO-2023]